jgi:hypothetical protein
MPRQCSWTRARESLGSDRFVPLLRPDCLEGHRGEIDVKLVASFEKLLTRWDD